MNKVELNILLVDDDPLTGRFVQHVLHQASDQFEFVLRSALSLAQTRSALQECAPDLILLDLGLSDSSGLDTVRQTAALCPEIPIVVLTGTSDEELGIQAIHEGAEDYIVKVNLSKNLAVRTLCYAIERKKMKLRLLQAQDELENRVQKRTLELATTNFKLKQEIAERINAEGQLEQLNRDLQGMVERLTLSNLELQDFAHAVSHDLKSPVRAIGTLAGWLRTDYADRFDEEGREKVQILAHRADHLNRMIDGILQYCGIGRLEESFQPVNLADKIPQIWDGLEPPDRIRLDVETPLPTLVCEEGRISQVFRNLLQNAVQYNDKPQGLVRVGCQDRQTEWLFYVADNGVGIDSRDTTRIFELFETLTSLDEKKGLGLGLCLVRRVVERYGGKIWVESVVGQSTLFWFSISKSLPLNERGLHHAGDQTHSACGR